MAIHHSHSYKRLFLSLKRHFLSPIFQSRPFSAPISHPANPNFKPHPNFPQFSHNWVRAFTSRLSESSNSNRPPKEAITLEGCDFEHWLVVVEKPDSELTRDEIVDEYIKTLAHVIGSEEEARMKIYSVSTRHYFAFGALISEELSNKLKELPNVNWVLPDSYMDVKNKTYAGEPFINGQAVPYDPKYHEIWVRNHEESLRNSNRKRQKDPKSRSRLPAYGSTQDSSSGHWVSSPVHQNQAPPTYSQNQAPQPSGTSGTHDNTTLENPPPPKTGPYSPDYASPGHIGAPAVGPENQARHPSHMQNQTPPPSSYDLSRHGHFYNNNQPPSAPANNPSYHGPGWGAASGYQIRSPPPPTGPTLNNFSSENVQPSQVQKTGYSHWDFPHKAQNNYSSYDTVNNSNPIATPSLQNYQVTNVPSHPRNQQDVPSEVQQNGYYGHSPHHVQNGGAHIFQHQKYQQHNSRGVQKSNEICSPRDWKYPSNQQHRTDIKYQDFSVQNAGYSGGNLSDDTRMEIGRSRDIQDRDIPVDDYMYESKMM